VKSASLAADAAALGAQPEFAFSEDEYLARYPGGKELAERLETKSESAGFTAAKANAKKIHQRRRAEARLSQFFQQRRLGPERLSHSGRVGRHVRAPGRRPVRSRGSRRSTTSSSGSRTSGSDPGDPDPSRRGRSRRVKKPTQLDLGIGCADQTAHKNISICWRCGWNSTWGQLPWEVER
jgi:hypothetical protein